MDTAYNVVESNDVDIWGYRLMDREYTSSLTDNDYLFTGKERDNEKSGYDYFGARYFDSRIGRWGTVDPMSRNYISYSPYNYVANNPLILYDPDGMVIDFSNYERQDPNSQLNLDLLLTELNGLTDLGLKIENGYLTYDEEKVKYLLT